MDWFLIFVILVRMVCLYSAVYLGVLILRDLARGGFREGRAFAFAVYVMMFWLFGQLN